MNKIKKIGVLTSGGDAPGMNAAIRACVRYGCYHGFEMYGIYKGYYGLITGDIKKLGERDVSGILQKGGTFLKTARCPEFLEEKYQLKAKTICEVFDLDLVIVIGGDGSYRGALDLMKRGVPVMCLPGTIDNDISSTEYTIGFDTALNTIQEAIDKIRDTAYSHERCSVVEVMGRNAGYIAINDGIGGGADAILIPEKPYDIDEDIIKPIFKGRRNGKNDFCIIVAEGVKNINEICSEIEEKTGIATRKTVLGYVQRGGSPTNNDRVMASRMGAFAIKAASEGRVNRVISLVDNKLIDIEIEEALNTVKYVDDEIYNLVKILSM